MQAEAREMSAGELNAPHSHSQSYFSANNCLDISTHLAPDLNGHGVGELEGVEEGVGDDGGAGVRGAHLHELGDHLGAQDAPVAVAQLDGTVLVVRGLARLDPHVEFAWREKGDAFDFTV